VLPGFARSPYVAPVRIRAPAHAEISRGTLGGEIDTTDSRQAADRAEGASAPKIAHDPRERGLVDELNPTAFEALIERYAAFGFGNEVAVDPAPVCKPFWQVTVEVDFA
jgi:hypothetical protein